MYVKSKKKNTSAEMSHTGSELSGYRTVLVPKCFTQVPNCPGAEVSSIHFPYVQYNYDAGMSLQWYEFTVVRVYIGTSLQWYELTIKRFTYIDIFLIY